MRHSREYVYQFLDFLKDQPVKRIMLPDTLGVLIPSEVYEYVSAIVQRYPQIHFDFHAHNDYDLGTANVLEAVKAGAKGIHLTINGMGERAGKPFRKEIDIPALFLYNKHDDDVTVAPGDVIYVNRAPLFYIYGEVQKPGAYPLQRDLTVRQAIAIGGGLTVRGTERGLRVSRRDTAGKIESHKVKLNGPLLIGDVLQVKEALF